MNKVSLPMFAAILVFCSILGACAAAENSAGMVVENAGEVIRYGRDKAFIDPEPTPHKEDRY